MARLSRSLLPFLALLALSARLLVPAGYMPEHNAQGWTLDICTGHGALKVDVGGKPAKQDGGASSLCAFACALAPFFPAVAVALTVLAIGILLGEASRLSGSSASLAVLRLRPPLRAPPLR